MPGEVGEYFYLPELSPNCVNPGTHQCFFPWSFFKGLSDAFINPYEFSLFMLTIVVTLLMCVPTLFVIITLKMSEIYIFYCLLFTPWTSSKGLSAMKYVLKILRYSLSGFKRSQPK